MKLNMGKGCFAIENPLHRIDRWINDFDQRQLVLLNQREIQVSWITRAHRALQQRRKPLRVEMQLYYSCVQKKRILFHDQVNYETTHVNDKLEIAFRPVFAAACGPEVFASDDPMAGEPSSRVCAVPDLLEFDFRNERWEGVYGFGPLSAKAS